MSRLRHKKCNEFMVSLRYYGQIKGTGKTDAYTILDWMFCLKCNTPVRIEVKQSEI